MKALIVGIGAIGRRHFQNLRRLGFRDVAVVDTRRQPDAPQRSFFRTFRPRRYRVLAVALREGKPDIVFVTNPTSTHMVTARTALRAGAHVFVEKPISHTMAGVDRLIAEARRRRRVLYVGYHFRHHPQLKAVKRLLEHGRLGRILSARFITGEYLPGWHPWEDFRKGYAARKDLGGGVVLTQSHDLDLAYWLFGRPKRIQAVVRNSGTFSIDVDDIADILLEFPAGLVVSSHLDYLARPPEKRFIITGERGRLEWDYHGGTLLLTTADGRKRFIDLPSRFERNDMYIAEAKDFLRCIRAGEQPKSDGRSGAAVLEMALAAKAASRAKRSITFTA